MRYGLDMDGVVVDFFKVFVPMLSEYFSNIPPSYVPKHYKFNIDFGISNTKYHRVMDEIFNRPNFWLNLPPIDHEIKFLKQYMLAHRNDEFFFITARPKTGINNSVLRQTNGWLANQGIYNLNSSVVIVEHGLDKAKVCEALGIDRAIDDRYDIVETNPEVFTLRLAPWNQEGFMEGKVKGVSKLSEWLTV